MGVSTMVEAEGSVTPLLDLSCSQMTDLEACHQWVERIGAFWLEGSGGLELRKVVRDWHRVERARHAGTKAGAT